MVWAVLVAVGHQYCFAAIWSSKIQKGKPNAPKGLLDIGTPNMIYMRKRVEFSGLDKNLIFEQIIKTAERVQSTRTVPK